MPRVFRTVLNLPNPIDEVELALRAAIRLAPGIGDGRIPKSQHYSAQRPWMGHVGEGNIDVIRQSLNPRSSDWRVIGSLHSTTKGSLITLSFHVSWIELLVAALLVGLILYIGIHSLDLPNRDPIARWVPLMVGVFLCCAIPFDFYFRIRRVRREFTEMCSSKGAIVSPTDTPI